MIQILKKWIKWDTISVARTYTITGIVRSNYGDQKLWSRWPATRDHPLYDGTRANQRTQSNSSLWETGAIFIGTLCRQLETSLFLTKNSRGKQLPYNKQACDFSVRLMNF